VARIITSARLDSEIGNLVYGNSDAEGILPDNGQVNIYQQYGYLTENPERLTSKINIKIPHAKRK